MKINEIATKDDADIKTVTKENYGQEAIFDINSVSPDFFKKKTIREFAEKRQPSSKAHNQLTKVRPCRNIALLRH